MKKKNKKILKGVLLGMACALATGLVLQVTNVFDLFTEETSTEEPSEELKLGTAVPNEGNVDKIYLNTNLSVEEVVSVLENASLNFNHKDFYDDGLDSYLVFDCSTTGIYEETISCSLHISYVEGFYAIMYEQILLWSNVPEIAGWNPEQNENFINPLDLSEFGLKFVSNVNGEVVGASNEALSSLFSITPFE